MDDKFKSYLIEIGFTDILNSNVEKVIDTVELVFGKNIKDIFVSQTPDGNDFRNIVMFIDNQMILVQNFKYNPEYHVLTINKTITYIKILPQKFEFNDYSENSMLTLNVNIAGSEFYLDPLFATKGNCQYLYKILQTYFLPNLFE